MPSFADTCSQMAVALITVAYLFDRYLARYELISDTYSSLLATIISPCWK
jgi:hypothetical protein